MIYFSYAELSWPNGMCFWSIYNSPHSVCKGHRRPCRKLSMGEWWEGGEQRIRGSCALAVGIPKVKHFHQFGGKSLPWIYDVSGIFVEFWILIAVRTGLSFLLQVSASHTAFDAVPLWGCSDVNHSFYLPWCFYFLIFFIATMCLYFFQGWNPWLLLLIMNVL